MNTQIHAQHTFNFCTLILLILLQVLTLSAQAALVVEPAAPIVEVGKSITLSVTGTSNVVTWTAIKGQIQKTGSRVYYVAPTQPGLDVVTVFDGPNVKPIKITVLSELTKTFSAKNAVWEVFTNRSTIQAISLSDNGKTLWVGSRGGLEKRDAITGQLLRIYTNLDGLPRNRVSSLLADGHGGVWVSTYDDHGGGGLAHLYANGTWKIFNKDNSYLPGNYVSAMSKDGHGGIWMGVNKKFGSDSSLVHFHHNGTWNIFNTDNSNLPYNNIRSIFASDQGDIWIGTDDGLAHLKLDGSWDVFNPSNSELPSKTIRSIIEDGKGGLWAASSSHDGGGLIHIDANGTWQFFDTQNTPLQTEWVSALASDEKGGVWVGTLGVGIGHFHSNGTWDVFKTINRNYALPSSDINSFYPDGEGGIWIGTGNGFAHLHADGTWDVFNSDKTTGLQSNYITSISKDDKSGLWIGTGSGVAHYSADGTWKALDNYRIGGIGTIAISDASGGSWIASWKALYHYHVNGTWDTFNQDNSKIPLNETNEITSLLLDGHGGIWMGIVSYGDNNSGSLTHLHADGQWEIFNVGNSDLPNNEVNTILSDGSGGIWLGTGDWHGGGLVHLHADGRWEIFNTDNSGLPDNTIKDLLADNKGGIWVATISGLAQFSADGTWKIFNKFNSGLPGNWIDSLAKDGQGGIWVSVGELAHFHADGTWTIFNVNNSGLPSSWIGPIVEDEKGGVWIGTVSGLAHLSFTEKVALCANAQSDAECEKQLKSHRAAILIHPKGQGDGYNQETAVDFMASYAYQTLHARGYDNDEIYFLSYKPDLDINADGITDVNAVDAPVKFFDARDKAIQARDLNLMDIRAAFNWAKQQGKLDYPLLVTFVDHGAPNQLLLDPLATQTLTGSEFKTILDDYQNTTGNQIAVILEACHTGTLVPTLAGTNRIIVSSTGTNLSYYNDYGKKSFLKFYFDRLRRGENFWRAWQSVKSTLSRYSWPHNQQVPQLNDSTNGTLAQQLCLNGCFDLPGTITLIMPKLPANVPVGQAIELNVSTQISFGHVQEVMVSLLSPDMTFNKFGHSYQASQVTYLKPINTRRREGRQQQWQGKLSADKLTTPGTYTLTVKARDNNGFSTDEHVTFCVGQQCQQSQNRLINISTRAAILGGANDVIAGFIITGTGTQKVIIRGLGLEAGVDPKLTVHQYPSSDLLASNDNWQTDPRVGEIPAHLVLPNPIDAGVLLDLPVGAYTAILSSEGAKGLGLISVDEVEPNGTTKLINISTRASIQGGANDVIAGFIITGSGSQKVMIRGLALESGVNPKLTLQKYPSGEPVASNDNWLTDSRASEIPEHLKLQSPIDAGLLLDLPVGAYTAILSSVGAKGLGLVGLDAID